MKSPKHLAKVAALPCSVCDATPPSECHHLRQGAGMGRKNSDYLAIALCPDCHRGSKGIHGNRDRLKDRKMEEIDALAITLARLDGKL